MDYKEVPYQPTLIIPNGPPQIQQQMPLQAVIKDRPAFSNIEMFLAPQQQILANGHSMTWMDGNVRIETNLNDCGPACCRWLAGESACQNTFTGPGKITFAQKLPGDVLPFAVTAEEGWILSGGSFICGSPDLKVDGRFSGCAVCLCSGEGAFLTEVTVAQGQGVFYAGSYGALTRHEIQAGKTMLVDSGLFFAASNKTNIQITLAGDCAACCCGKVGFVMKFTGPSVIYTQNRNPKIWRRVLRPQPPPKAAQIVVVKMAQ